MTLDYPNLFGNRCIRGLARAEPVEGRDNATNFFLVERTAEGVCGGYGIARRRGGL
jgi:hypothetical protein